MVHGQAQINSFLNPLDNFELTSDDEITLKGFLDLHVMTAEDEEGGVSEIWEVLDAMGYNKQLQLDQVSRSHSQSFMTSST